MTIWSPEIDETGPVYLAITRALESDIARGRILAGDRLPTHRDLAAELGVNVGTITRAYGEARRRGLIEGEVGRGTFVRMRPPSGLSRVEPERESGPIDLSINIPLAMPSPDLSSALERLVTRGDLESRMAYQDPAGSLEARLAGTRWLSRIGIDAEPEGVVVCSGAQHAILVALAAIAGPGDLVLCEALTYPGFLGAARLLGLRVRGIEIDEHGLIPEALEEACRNERPRLLYCMPSLQNPTCAQLPIKRREAIAEIAERNDLVLVQDEIQGGLIEDPSPSLATLLPDRVLTIAGLSKILSPGIRIAFLAGTPTRAARLAELVWSSIWMTSPLGAELACLWLEDDTTERVLAARAEEMVTRHALVSRALEGLPYQTRPGAYQVWLPLPERWDNATATTALAKAGVKVSSSEEFRVEGAPAPAALRLSLSATRSHERLESALETIHRVLESPPPRTTLL
jgi:DNA-binding transcriptional MocR family regulator